MSKLYRYYQRGRHPRGFWGGRVLTAMNSKAHAAMPEWALAELKVNPGDHVLDMGCGGGANIDRILTKCPECMVRGIDLSKKSLEYTTELNYRAVKDGQCFVIGGSATQLPLAKDSYEIVMAFETIYYWPTIAMGFSEALRVLKPGGTFIIGNELDGEGQQYRDMEKAIGGIRIYTIEEIEQQLEELGFIDIKSRHHEQEHFICVMAKKPNED